MAIDCEVLVGKHRFFVVALSSKARRWMLNNFADVPHNYIMGWSVDYKKEILNSMLEVGLTYDA